MTRAFEQKQPLHALVDNMRGSCRPKASYHRRTTKCFTRFPCTCDHLASLSRSPVALLPPYRHRTSHCILGDGEGLFSARAEPSQERRSGRGEQG